MLQGESFWSAVYEPFMVRDLTRDDLRLLVSKGLKETNGSYKLLVQLFNMKPDDYKRFLNFLRKHNCHMPFQQFRAAPVPATMPSAVNEDAMKDWAATGSRATYRAKTA